MGKKHQHDREQKREKYATRQQKQSNKNKIIAIAILSVIVSIIGYSIYEFSTLDEGGTPGGPTNAGRLGSAHIHAGILVKIFGDTFDFSTSGYQVKTPWIHFEGQNGDTIHRHATGVELGYLFDSLGITVNDQCYIFPNERMFCNDEQNSLKFYINGESTDDLMDYVVQEDDRILVSFGDESQDEIQKQIQEVQNLLLDIR